MIVKFRDESLKYTMDIKKEKINLVLEWLLEFRFSSVDLLARRLNTDMGNSYRFFNSLVKDGVIMKFKNVHTRNNTYLMLTTTGVSYLEGEGVCVKNAVTRVSNLGKYSNIIHDMAVQEAALKRIKNYKEIIWDRNIELEGSEEKPDLLLKKDNGTVVALEYERWRKDRKRIFRTFFVHAKRLMNKEYRGVYYVFDKKIDMAYYEKMFNERVWNMYKREKKTGRIQPLNESFEPDKIENLRKCFIFIHEPIE